MQIKLLPDAAQASTLELTLHTLNQHANRVSKVAFANKTFRNYDLRRLTYAGLRDAGIGSQAAQHVIKKVADAYTTLRANIRAGNLGKEGSLRRVKAENTPIRFRSDAAQPFDQRNLSFALGARTISLWTVTGRLKNVPFACSDTALTMLAECKRGESDLLRRDGMWFLLVAVDAVDTPLIQPAGFVGIDLGIANIATTCDGTRHSGRHLNQVRHRHRRLRRRLQAKGTRSARRLLRKRRRREARFAADTNHRIAKRIVTEAERTGRGVALEDLGGIRDRVRLRKPQRVTLHSWAFHQLGAFIAYKAARAGLPVVCVDPAYTSQGCSACGHVDKNNRPDQATFCCTSCGFAEHADVNAARNIAVRGAAGWAVSHAADDAA